MVTSLSQLYPTARQNFATKQFDWTAGPVKILLLASSYVPNFATDANLSDVPSSAIIATSAAITNLAASGGYCTGDTTGFGIVTSPTLAGKLIFFHDTGTPSTSTLLLFVDTPDLPGMPQVINGLNYFVYRNLNYGGWFRL